jgi:hypothetical protein
MSAAKFSARSGNTTATEGQERKLSGISAGWWKNNKTHAGDEVPGDTRKKERIATKAQRLEEMNP